MPWKVPRNRSIFTRRRSTRTRSPITPRCASNTLVTGAIARSYGSLSRYDDIVEAARDWETFSSTQGNMIDELPGRAGATLGTTDPPRHDRLRALSQAAFLRKNLDRMVAPTIEIADRSLDRICEPRTFEFINDFSSQITVGLLFRTMGLPERDHAEIRRKVILAVSTDKSGERPHARAHRRLQGTRAIFSPRKWRRGAPIRPTT